MLNAGRLEWSVAAPKELQHFQKNGIYPAAPMAYTNAMELTTVKIDKPEPVNFILGQAHFIKSVEDLHEALV